MRTARRRPTSAKRPEIAAATSAGRRKNNEDAVEQYQDCHSRAALLVVADGMGGHAAGEVASRIAIETVVEAFEDEGFSDAEELLREATIDAHRRILRVAAADERRQGMGTTIVAAAVLPTKVIVGHVGDSRAFQFRGSCVRRLTADDLAVIESLGIDEAQAKHHAMGHMLSQALGHDADVDVHVKSFDLQPGDFVLLCTDGVSEFITEPRMHEVLHQKPLAAAIDALVREAIELGSKDNCTIAACRIG